MYIHNDEIQDPCVYIGSERTGPNNKNLQWAMGNGPWRKSKIEARGIILASNAGLNSPQTPVASQLCVIEVKKKERACHFTGSWKQQSSSPPVNLIFKRNFARNFARVSSWHGLPPKSPTFSIFFLWKRAESREKNREIQA